jgi:hypothetical protein
MVGPQMPVGQHIGGSKNSTSTWEVEAGMASNKGTKLLILVQSPLKCFGKKN